MVNRYICSIDERLSERDLREVTFWPKSTNPSINALQSDHAEIKGVYFITNSKYRLILISFQQSATVPVRKGHHALFLLSGFELVSQVSVSEIWVISLSFSITSPWWGRFMISKKFHCRSSDLVLGNWRVPGSTFTELSWFLRWVTKQEPPKLWNTFWVSLSRENSGNMLPGIEPGNLYVKTLASTEGNYICPKILLRQTQTHSVQHVVTEGSLQVCSWEKQWSVTV